MRKDEELVKENVVLRGFSKGHKRKVKRKKGLSFDLKQINMESQNLEKKQKIVKFYLLSTFNW